MPYVRPPYDPRTVRGGRLAARQAADILHQLSELRALVDLTGIDLAAATRREIETDLHQSTLPFTALQLSVHERATARCAG